MYPILIHQHNVRLRLQMGASAPVPTPRVGTLLHRPDPPGRPQPRETGVRSHRRCSGKYSTRLHASSSNFDIYVGTYWRESSKYRKVYPLNFHEIVHDQLKILTIILIINS